MQIKARNNNNYDLRRRATQSRAVRNQVEGAKKRRKRFARMTPDLHDIKIAKITGL